jgi:hypothetical protein
MIVVGASVSLIAPAIERKPFMFAWDALAIDVWLVGTVLGLAMGLNWMVTVSANRVNRAFLRVALVSFCTYLLTVWGVALAWKYTIDLIGMLLMQSIYFHLFGVPDWILRGNAIAQTTAKSSQFRIVDLLAWTTGLAILLALSIRVDPQAFGVHYWSVLCVLWLVVPMAAMCWTLAGLLPGLSRAQISWLATACLLTLFLSAGLAWAELRSMNPAKMNVSIVSLYAILFGGLGLTMLLFSVAGSWLGQAKPSQIRPPEVKPPVESLGG